MSLSDQEWFETFGETAEDIAARTKREEDKEAFAFWQALPHDTPLEDAAKLTENHVKNWRKSRYTRYEDMSWYARQRLDTLQFDAAHPVAGHKHPGEWPRKECAKASCECHAEAAKYREAFSKLPQKERDKIVTLGKPARLFDSACFTLLQAHVASLGFNPEDVQVRFYAEGGTPAGFGDLAYSRKFQGAVELLGTRQSELLDVVKGWAMSEQGPRHLRVFCTERHTLYLKIKGKFAPWGEPLSVGWQGGRGWSLPKYLHTEIRPCESVYSFSFLPWKKELRSPYHVFEDGDWKLERLP